MVKVKCLEIWLWPDDGNNDDDDDDDGGGGLCGMLKWLAISQKSQCYPWIHLFLVRTTCIQGGGVHYLSTIYVYTLVLCVVGKLFAKKNKT